MRPARPEPATVRDHDARRADPSEAQGAEALPPASLGPALLAGALLAAGPALAQSLTVDLGAGGATERALQLVALITVLALAPSVLVMATSFTRIVVVLSILRSALGHPDARRRTR